MERKTLDAASAIPAISNTIKKGEVSRSRNAPDYIQVWSFAKQNAKDHRALCCAKPLFGPAKRRNQPQLLGAIWAEII
jgi:hypothetical protein